jgi:hypothetical protein
MFALILTTLYFLLFFINSWYSIDPLYELYNILTDIPVSLEIAKEMRDILEKFELFLKSRTVLDVCIFYSNNQINMKASHRPNIDFLDSREPDEEVVDAEDENPSAPNTDFREFLGGIRFCVAAIGTNANVSSSFVEL